MKRPTLNKIPLSDVLPPRPGVCMCTLSVGQWDHLLRVAYSDGWVLLEVNDDEQPVAAYKRPHRGAGG